MTNNLLNSLGSIISLEAKNSAGDLITTFLKNFSLTINFSQFDLSRFNLDTLSIYSSPDGQNWTKENTQVDLNNRTATTSLNHLTYFALMAERIDIIAPTTTPVLKGDEGISGNFRSDVNVNLSALDNQGGLGVEFTAYSIGEEGWQTYTSPLEFIEEGNHKIYFYSEDNDGNVEEIKTLEFSIDKTPPDINITSPEENKVYLLNQTSIQSDFSCSDAGGSELKSCEGSAPDNENVDLNTPGEKTFTVNAFDNALNQTTKNIIYKIQYLSDGLCNGESGHIILQPINPDGTSVFKQKSTIPAKFRVCDANGNPISENAVKSFTLVKSESGTSSVEITEPVDSTTPESNFRFDPTNKLWIFNMSTKNLTAGKTYFYKILLSDLTDIQFNFGLK